MMDTILLLSILIFAGMLLFFLAGYYFVIQRRARRRFAERVRAAGTERFMDGEGSEIHPSGFLSKAKGKILRVLEGLGHLARKGGEEENPTHIRKTFSKAGFRSEKAPMIFFGSKLFLALLLALLVSLLQFLFLPLMPSAQFTLLAVTAAVAGYYLPNLWVRLKIRHRRAKILEGLPDALDLMVVCVEAGIGLDAAIQRVGDEMKLSNKPLSDEFRLMTLELRAGKPRRDALRDLAMRTDLEDVNSLASVLIQTEKFGTSIAQALRVHSDAMRVRRFQRAEEVAAKLPVKLLFPLIFFIFPSLFVAILGPAAIQIIRTLLPTLGGR